MWEMKQTLTLNFVRLAKRVWASPLNLLDVRLPLSPIQWCNDDLVSGHDARALAQAETALRELQSFIGDLKTRASMVGTEHSRLLCQFAVSLEVDQDGKPGGPVAALHGLIRNIHHMRQRASQRLHFPRPTRSLLRLA